MTDFDAELFLRVLQTEYSEEYELVSQMSRAKHWCFTLNNYKQEDVDRITDNASSFDYVVFGKETGDSGTPHLQGFVSFPQRVRRPMCLEKIGNAHFTIARHIDNSIQYCKKDGDFIEIGVPPKGQGSRSDLESFKLAVATGVTDPKRIRQEFSLVAAKYPKFVSDFIADHKPKKTVEMHPLRDWQQAMYTALKQPPDSRSIYFLVDYEGNSGKTWFAHYYCFLNDNAQVLLPGKKADMAFALDTSVRVLFIDAPRSKQGEFLQYDFLEDVKNGYIFCPKYESKVTYMQPCHVVVMMNEDPDMNKLSKDRYVIRRLKNNDP